MNNFWKELKRRNVIKAAISYAVFSWVLIQVASILFPSFGWGQKAINNTLIILIIGFPLWLIFAFVFEWTSKGFKKTVDVTEEQSVATTTSKRLNGIIITGLSIAVLLLVADRIFKFTESEVLNKSIAILYFDNMSADANNKWLGEGMTESITTHLKPNKNLTVIGRTSLKKYRDSDVTIPEIAKELSVNFIVEGSVMKQDSILKITAQLINAKNEHIWSDEYNVSFEDFLKVQSDIAKKIVQKLEINLTVEEEKQIGLYPTQDIKAFELFIRGNMTFDKQGVNAEKEAIKFYEQALELDPNYTDAMAGLAYAMVWLDTKKAEEYADKAINIDANCTKAWATKGVAAYISGNFKRAKELLNKSLEIDPEAPWVHDYLASIYLFGPLIDQDFEKGMYHSKIASTIDPLSQIFQRKYIFALIKTGQYALVKERLEEKRYMFDKTALTLIERMFVRTNAEVLSKQNKDYNQAIKVFEKAIDSLPHDAARYKIRLGMAYNFYFNDNENYLKYAQQAFEAISTTPKYKLETEEDIKFTLFNYYPALLENKKYEEALSLMESQLYKDEFNDWLDFKHQNLINYYYAKGDYQKALTIMQDSLPEDKYWKPILYARLGKTKTLQELINNLELSEYKATVFAILKERDSMYYYLNQDGIDFKYINSDEDFNPYRNDPEFRAFLKKHDLPLTHWNE